MARSYYRVGPGIWDEEWDDDTRYVAFYLLTNRHRSTEGLYRLPLDYGSTDMSWPPRRFRKAFDRLVACGFVEHDPDAQVVFVVNALVYQSPANPNQVKAAVKAVAELPRTPLIYRLAAVADEHAESFAKALRERFPERFREAVANTPSPPTSPNHPLTPASGGTVDVAPPVKPTGGRSRDRVRYDEQVRVYAARLVPSMPEPGRSQTVAAALGWLDPEVHGPVTNELVRRCVGHMEQHGSMGLLPAVRPVDDATEEAA